MMNNFINYIFLFDETQLKRFIESRAKKKKEEEESKWIIVYLSMEFI